jgi:[ribosomal protein S5]-alanine N-acetyltransferase
MAQIKKNISSYLNQSSQRLTFRKLTEADIPVWTEFFIDNETLPFLGIDLTKSPHEQAQNWIQIQLERYKNNDYGHLAAIEKDTGLFIGMGGILPREIDSESYFEIAYSLKKEFWGKGYGTEIAMQMKQYGRANKVAEHFISIIHKENIASIKVAEKNGMTVLREMIYNDMPVFVYHE